MLNVLRNKKGVWPLPFLLVFTLTVGLAARGLYETSKNGVLKNNGKIIWCKMQNKGAQYCDNLYSPENINN